jgi:hypothetical protein
MSRLPDAVWYDDNDESLGRQAVHTLTCGHKQKVVASMHSLGSDWIIRVNAQEVYPESWRLGIGAYPDAKVAEWAAEHYVEKYRLCPSAEVYAFPQEN